MSTLHSPPKLVSPNRSQGVLLMPTSFDSLIEESHPARSVWSFVETLDLGPFVAQIRTRVGEAGRPAVDPHLLLALWMYATVDGVDSGRKLARLCHENLVYRWMCGGVSVEYHTLNDFRSENADALRTVLTRSVSALIAGGVISVETVALDGVRVRASAGASSFRSARRLRELSAAVERRIADLMEAWKENGTDPNSPGPRRKRREAQERVNRLKSAIEAAEELDRVRASELQTNTKIDKKRRAKIRSTLERGSRASSSDPQSAILKMADGGFRPAVNSYVSTDTRHGFVLDVHVTSDATDNAELPNAVDRLSKAYGTGRVKNVLADSGFRDERAMSEMEKGGVAVYTPLPKPRGERAVDAPVRHESAVQRDWRARMTSEEGQNLYGLRGRFIEFVFAGFRNRGLRQLRVRGRLRSTAVLLLHSLTHNFFVASLKTGARRAA